MRTIIFARSFKMPLFSSDSSHLPTAVVSHVLLGFFSDKDIASLSAAGKREQKCVAETFAQRKGKKLLQTHEDYLLLKSTRLNSKIGYQMLGEGLLTIDEAHRMGNSKLNTLICEHGLTALRKKYLNIDEIYKLKNHFSLQDALSTQNMEKYEQTSAKLKMRDNS